MAPLSEKEARVTTAMILPEYDTRMMCGGDDDDNDDNDDEEEEGEEEDNDEIDAIL